jgi:hypothetical protein
LRSRRRKKEMDFMDEEEMDGMDEERMDVMDFMDKRITAKTTWRSPLCPFRP